MPHSPAQAPHSSLSGWRRAEVVGLVATIPAFYMAMLSEHRAIAVGLYLLGFVASALVVWFERRTSREEPHSRLMSPSRHGLGLILLAALLLSAVVPAGDGVFSMGIRGATSLLIIIRWSETLRLWYWRGSLPYVATLAIGVLVLCGAGFWWLEPRAKTFGDGLWLAFTTAATVGYGDIVPSTPAAKIFAVFVVLMGFAALSLVTAAIAAMWVQTEERRIEREILHDIHRQMRSLREDLAALRAEQTTGNKNSERQPM